MLAQVSTLFDHSVPTYLREVLPSKNIRLDKRQPICCKKCESHPFKLTLRRVSRHVTPCHAAIPRYTWSTKSFKGIYVYLTTSDRRYLPFVVFA